MSDFSSFSNYKQTVMDITCDLNKLREYSKEIKLEGNTEAIDEVLKRLKEDNFSVAVIGEFKRGKSTLINALLGKDVLPTDVLPCSATLNKITYSVAPFVKIEYKDGNVEEIGIDLLGEYVTKLTRESEERAKNIKEATVYYPINYCKNGVTIIDTPGLNDDASMTEVTMSVLPQTDAALMVIMAQSPFSESERSFLESRIITSDLGRVMFVVTGVDLLDEDDVDRVLENITNRIQEHVITKARNTYGEDSKEFENYKNKIGKVRVFGLSAKKALKAKLKDDDAMLEQSLFPEFEKELERFLTEDRGAVMLSVPLNRMKTSSMEIVKAVQLRENVLKMQKEEFDERYAHAMEEIETIRQDRQSEFIRINEAADNAYQRLIPAVQDYWPSLERAALDAIDGFSLTEADIKKEQMPATQEAMLNAIRNALARESQNISERIQDSISIALESEAERISGFEQHFFNATEKVQNLFVHADTEGVAGDELSTGDMAIATVGNYFFSLGSIYTGYKQAGWKGALLGGGVGLAGTYVGTVGGLALVMAIGIPVAWPALLIGAVVGTFASKFAVGKVFGTGVDNIEKIRDAFANSMLEELRKMKAQDNFSDKVREQVDTAFNALKEKITTETEYVLSDTQNQLTELKVKLAESEIMSEKEKEELKEMLENVNEICKRAEETSKQLAAIMTK